LCTEIDQPIRSSQHRKLIAVDSAKSISATATAGVLKGEKPAELREPAILSVAAAATPTAAHPYDRYAGGGRSFFASLFGPSTRAGW
jgi:hypothetical protein